MEALLSLSNDLAGAVERAAPSIVAVHARRRLPSTGIHWRPGIVVTADHTVRAEDGITVETADGRARPAAGSNWNSRIPKRVLTASPPVEVSTTSLVLPTARANAASENGFTILSGVNLPRICRTRCLL